MRQLERKPRKLRGCSKPAMTDRSVFWNQEIKRTDNTGLSYKYRGENSGAGVLTERCCWGATTGLELERLFLALVR